jgi:nitrous oxide reductase
MEIKMMTKDEFYLNLGKQVREVMIKHGARTVYQNKRKTMRAVKCYARDINTSTPAFVDDINALMHLNAFFKYDIKINVHPTRSPRDWYAADSIVVRLVY